MSRVIFLCTKRKVYKRNRIFNFQTSGKEKKGGIENALINPKERKEGKRIRKTNRKIK